MAEERRSWGECDIGYLDESRVFDVEKPLAQRADRVGPASQVRSARATASSKA